MTTAKKRPNRPKGRASQKPAASQPQKRNIPWLGIAFGVIAIALVGAIVFSSDQAIGSEFGDVTIDGDDLPGYLAGVPDTGIGAPAPEVTGVDFAGNTVEIKNDGVPKVVLFLAHWCPFCQEEVPAVQTWFDAGGGVDGVEFISVATRMNSARPNFPPSEWLEREGWTAPIIRDDSDSAIFDAYGVSGFPFYAFIDADGNISQRLSGRLEVPQLQAAMEAIAP